VSHAPSHASFDCDPAGNRVAIERLLVTTVGAASGWLAVACGGVLLASRLSGGATAASGVVMLAAVCGAGGLLVAAGDLASRHGGGRPSLAPRIGFLMAALAMALPLPVGSSGALVMAMGAVVFAGALLAQPWAAPWLGIPSPVTVPLVPYPLESSPPACIPADVDRSLSPPDAATWNRGLNDFFHVQPAGDEHLLQQQERVTRADGTECVRGRLFLAVPTGVRTASGHVGFCPPFMTIPTVEVTTSYDEVEAIVTATEVLPWGVRIECRLDEPADEAFEIPIDIVAATDSLAPSESTSASHSMPPYSTTCES
jgi:hypothetical protein